MLRVDGRGRTGGERTCIDNDRRRKGKRSPARDRPADVVLEDEISQRWHEQRLRRRIIPA